MRALRERLGLVEAERFIVLIRQDTFDYTEWQRSLWADKSLDELLDAAKLYSEKQSAKRGAEMLDRITVNPGIHFGKPCIAGTRITVQTVLELINEGLTFDEILKDYYPDLTIEGIHACMSYAIALVSSEEIHI